MSQTFTSDQLLARVPGLTYRQLDWWNRRGHLSPERRFHQSGSGTPHAWTAEEAEIVSAISALVQVGFLPEKAATIVHAARAQGETSIVVGAVSVSWGPPAPPMLAGHEVVDIVTEYAVRYQGPLDDEPYFTIATDAENAKAHAAELARFTIFEPEAVQRTTAVTGWEPVP